uniref:DUF6699 domain-containing protein n=1 Tax=Mycena chlorophos TaxID=658473 RepID=A0ABQ0L5H7_MYCCL|nr:predicted protein [Mycena chlorophos]
MAGFLPATTSLRRAMAAPFLFVPETSGSASYQPYPPFAAPAVPHAVPGYPPHPSIYAAYPYTYPNTPAGPNTPFIPPSPLPFPNSPYLPPEQTGTPGGAFNANSVLWPSEDGYGGPYAGYAPNGYVRQRTQSWTGPTPAPHGSPFLAPAAAPAFLQTQYPGHRRANSHERPGAAFPAFPGFVPQQPQWTPLGPPLPHGYYPPEAIPQQIHPFLNGDAPSPDFHFDLSNNRFLPLRRAPHNPAQSMPLGAAELALPAFHPPRAAIRIIHPMLPFWPIDVTPAAPPPPANPYAPAAAPNITLADVLISLHRSLHARITPADWATLSPEQQQVVAHAFAVRCHQEAARSGAPLASLRDVEMSVRGYGVKRVDFLRGNTKLRGLTRVPQDGESVVRLVVG